LESKETKIQEIKRNFKIYYKEQDKKWGQMETLFLNVEKENFENRRKQIRSVLHMNEISKSIIKYSKKSIRQKLTFLPVQQTDLMNLSEEFNQFMNYAIHYLHSPKNSGLTDFNENFGLLLQTISKLEKKTIKQLKREEITVKNSLFLLQILSDTDNIAFHLHKILNSGV
jgi:Na+/phosphate symporter